MKAASKPHLRPSRVLAKLRRGGLVFSYKLNLDSSRAADLVAQTGFDCIWTCLEHTPNDFELIERQINAAKCHDVDVVVRVARGSYSDYIKPLELDATGIMVPHVMSADDARNIARLTRFHPVGRRPIDGGNADGQYCGIDFCEYIQQANEQRFVIIQIEDPEPLAELEAIAQVKGIDMLFFGPGDFSHSIGAPAQFDHPRVREARRRVAEVARKFGKFAGTLGGPENIEELAELGYQFLNLGADVVSLSRDCRAIVQACAGLNESE